MTFKHIVLFVVLPFIAVLGLAHADPGWLKHATFKLHQTLPGEKLRGNGSYYFKDGKLQESMRDNTCAMDVLKEFQEIAMTSVTDPETKKITLHGLKKTDFGKCTIAEKRETGNVQVRRYANGDPAFVKPKVWDEYPFVEGKGCPFSMMVCFGTPTTRMTSQEVLSTLMPNKDHSTFSVTHESNPESTVVSPGDEVTTSRQKPFFPAEAPVYNPPVIGPGNAPAANSRKSL